MQFNLAEVVARVQAGLRRSLAASGNVTRQMLLAAPFEFDLERHEVALKVDGTRHAPVLTLTELKLLAQVARAPRRVFIRGELMAASLPEGDALERTFGCHVSKLRKKLGDLGGGRAGERARRLQTVERRMKLDGLSRQIALTMGAMVFGVTLLLVLTGYVFYYLLYMYQPSAFNLSDWAPTGLEWVWLIATTTVGLELSVFVATHLARRILEPLNSVTDGIRRVARGELGARAVADDRSLREAALLADNFNALASELQRVTKEQAFWNAAIAHELRTPVTVLRGRLQGLAEGVFTPSETLYRSLLAQVEGLTRLIEDLRVISLADSGHLGIEIREADLAEDVRAVVDAFAHTLQAAGQHPEFDLDTRHMRCGPARIRQALSALLENVRRYAVPGAIRIHTRVEG